MTWLAMILAAQSAPQPATVAVSAKARIVAAVRVVGGRAQAAPVMQMRIRPGLRLVEFQ